MRVLVLGLGLQKVSVAYMYVSVVGPIMTDARTGQ